VQIKVGPNGEGMLVSVLYWTRTASLWCFSENVHWEHETKET
jgi:hypothetical protein